MRVKADFDLCESNAICVGIAPETFELDDDVASGAWAGVIPLTVRAGAPRPAPDVPAGIPVPASVRALSTAD